MRQVARYSSIAALVLALGWPAVVGAQGLTIQHDAVGCIVVGHYPKMSACFEPKGQLARGRVYFRPEGVSEWYYVEMQSDTPCWAAALPKPSKSLIDKHIEYYVQSADKSFNESQTQTYDPIVKGSESECKDKPIAPFASSGPAAVFPSIPAGFAAGGLGPGLIAGGILGAGAAAGGIYAATNSGGGGSSTTSTTTGSGPGNTTPATTPTTPTPTPTPQTNLPPNAIFSVNPDPPNINSGEIVTFNMCKSTDPEGDPLHFKFIFGDGSSDNDAGTPCRLDHTYVSSSSGGVRAAGSFPAHICVTDDHHPEICQDYTVKVKGDPCLNDKTPPDVSVSVTGAPQVNGIVAPPTIFFPILFEASVQDQSSVTVDYLVSETYPNPVGGVKVGGSSTPTNYPYTWDFATASKQFQFTCANRALTDFQVVAQATDACGNVGVSAPQTFETNTGFACFAPQAGVGVAEGGRLAWASDLEVPGGRGQVVLNGRESSFPRHGRSMGLGSAVNGVNRVEAQLVEASGQPGTWRFEFTGTGLAPGSLRVIAGDVAQVTDTAVTFRLEGTPGERVVFAFDVKP